MASHKVAIAKATFAASLLRPEAGAKSLTRYDATTFDTLLSAAIVRCSPPNVQACRGWLCSNIITSVPRTTSFSKFVFALSDAYQSEQRFFVEEQSVSPRRLRLHLLYILNDVMHWSKFHQEKKGFDDISNVLLQTTCQLVSTAARRDNTTRHIAKLSDLLSLWQANHYFNDEEFMLLRKSFDSACEADDSPGVDAAQDAAAKTPKEVPWILPQTHGDPLTPYYDLPAANMMPLITPTFSIPIETHRMKALRLSEGPADPDLVTAVQDLLSSAESLYNAEDEVGVVIPDVDAMGQDLTLDEFGERTGGESYYGWSRAFCEKLQKRAVDREVADAGRGRGGATSENHRSRSRSWQRSRSPRKRRRSASDSRSRSRSRTRRRGRYSSSPSRSRSRTGSRRRSRTPPQFISRADAKPLRPFQSQISATPIAHAGLTHPPPPPPLSAPPGMHFPPGMLSMRVPVPPLPMNISQNGMPVPPPKPPGWLGPWPPPPPPLPGNSSFSMPIPPPLGADNSHSGSVPLPTASGQPNVQAGRSNDSIDRSRDPRRR